MRSCVPAWLVLVAVLSGLTGCSSSTKVIPSGSSAGQQLEELKRAKDQGLVTDREYERMRRNIVRQND